MSANKNQGSGTDCAFGERALHLQKNIYGSDKGKLRLLILQRDLKALQQSATPLSVLDAGCGAGLMSEWFAGAGHQVLACDNSTVMVAQANNRLQAYPHARCRQQSIQSLPHVAYDVVLCHAVLEWVAEPTVVIDKLCTLIKPNGFLSLMFYNAWAREMAQLVYGNFDYIDKNYQVKKTVKLNPQQPTSPAENEAHLKQRGVKVISRSGIRIFYDILRHREHYQRFADAIIRHELRISRSHPFWQMGRYVHFLCQKID